MFCVSEEASSYDNSLSDKCQILSLKMNKHQMLSDRHSMDQKNPLFRKKPNILYEMTYRICAFHVKLEIFSHLQFPTVYGMWPYTNFTTNYVLQYVLHYWVQSASPFSNTLP